MKSAKSRILKSVVAFAALVAFAVPMPAAFAEEVAADEAREAARGWAALREALTGAERFAGAEIEKVETFAGRDGVGKFHVVSFKGGGYAVTSGDTEIAPILAYSEEGAFVASDENPLLVLLTRDVAGRTKRLGEDDLATRNAKDAKAEDGEGRAYGADEETDEEPQPSANASAWARLKAAGASVAPAGRPRLKAASLPRIKSVAELRVAPLCESRWAQGKAGDLNCYNYYTPSNRATGCVATGMAQIMRSFKYPDAAIPVTDRTYSNVLVCTNETGTVTNNIAWHVGKGYGDTWEFGGPAFGGPYDWDNMVADPHAAAQAGTLTEAQRQAIGLLCRDCGISLNMKYGLGGSAAGTAYVREQLKVRFGYANATLRYEWTPITYAEQMDAMLTSFDIGSPCQVGISGHSIVADGYGYSDGRVYVHMNYGYGNESISYSTAWYTPPSDGETSAYPYVGSIVYNIWTPNEREDSDVSVIVGTVVDASSNAVASATVTATSLTTDKRYTATTDERGAYSLFLPGDDTYALTARSGGATAWRTIAVETCTDYVVGNQRGVDLVLGSAAGGVDDLGWVCEKMETKEMTGTWTTGKVSYDPATGKAEFGGVCAFEPAAASGGSPVTMTVTATFTAVPEEEATPDATAQGAVWLGTNGCFQIWTRTGESQSSATVGWLDVEAEGVTPQAGVEYTFRFVFDYEAKTYGVEVKTESTGFARLREKNPVDPENPVQNFPMAATGSAISKVRFSGEGMLTSILGDYVEVKGFAADDEVILKDSALVILDAAKAAWLNSCAGDKTAVGSAAAGLSAQEFSDAYLLNLDITDGDRSYSFEITDVDVGAENVTVAVTLTRSGNIAQSVNGVLKFYGAATLEAFKSSALQPLSSETVSDDDFSDGNTATATYPKVSGSTTNTFFKAKIEER